MISRKCVNLHSFIPEFFVFYRLYSSPEDVDLFVGGMAEQKMAGAILGPTFVCIVGDQFARLRRGDRFYFEEQSARFSSGFQKS